MNSEGAGAIGRVLAAERGAAEAVERCRQAADQTIHEGLVQSRRILDRADRRITRVHAIADRAIERERACVRGEVASISALPEVNEADIRAMEWAVEVLILELTGARGAGVGRDGA